MVALRDGPAHELAALHAQLLAYYEARRTRHTRFAEVLAVPEMDGESLFKRIKANPKLNEIPVIVISSIGNPAKDRQLLDMGVQAVVKKPVSPAKIAEVFRDLDMMPK